jgi:hypothetical protein
MGSRDDSERFEVVIACFSHQVFEGAKWKNCVKRLVVIVFCPVSGRTAQLPNTNHYISAVQHNAHFFHKFCRNFTGEGSLFHWFHLCAAVINVNICSCKSAFLSPGCVISSVTLLYHRNVCVGLTWGWRLKWDKNSVRNCSLLLCRTGYFVDF